VNSAAKLFVVYTVLVMGIEQNPNSISIVFEQNRNEQHRNSGLIRFSVRFSYSITHFIMVDSYVCAANWLSGITPEFRSNLLLYVGLGYC